ncbi:hypothetical protein GCM10009647_081210 [Streptomyces sanglieri]|uniref:MFS transporter n=1 Tax=Streptomyces sanglieri TaxID=193460 RepID=A0ABW2WTJ4_9ACTN|nr:hypothetical protein [Streptomyces sp. Wh19]MDV9198913.1 hypothetical protein [Streptomyces sp. Wh19]
MLPSILIRVWVAGWSDRIRTSRIPFMIACNLVQAASISVVPLLWWLGKLSIPALLVVAAVGSAGLGVHASLSSPVLVQVVPEVRLVDANGKLAATRSAADISGPSIAGGLPVPAALTAPWAVPVDAVSFVASAMVLTRVRTHESGSDQAGYGTDSGPAGRWCWVLWPPLPPWRCCRSPHPDGPL